MKKVTNYLHTKLTKFHYTTIMHKAILRGNMLKKYVIKHKNRNDYNKMEKTRFF